MNDTPEQPAGPSRKTVAINKIRQYYIIVLAAFPLVFAVSLFSETWRARGPDLGFESLTGTKLPDGVMPSSHTARFIFGARRTHFWLLDGRREDFRRLAASVGLHRADEVVKTSIDPSVFDGKQPPELFEGYAGRMNDRNLWLFVIYPGNRAVFQY